MKKCYQCNKIITSKAIHCRSCSKLKERNPMYNTEGYWKNKKRGPLSMDTKKKLRDSNTGRKLPPRSEEWRRKRSISTSGKHYSKLTEFKEGHIPWNKDKINCFRHTEEWKQNCSKLSKGRSMSIESRIKGSESKRGSKNPMYGMLGPLSPHWQGGKSFEPYGLEFNNKLKEQIRARDNYICQECGAPQNELRSPSGRKYKLHIHHIDYNKRNNMDTNLISLCRLCHMNTNFNRIKWTQYYQARMELRFIDILALQEPEDIIIEMIE